MIEVAKILIWCVAIIGWESDDVASLRMQTTTAPCLINQNHVTLITWQSTQEELKIINLEFVQYQMVHGKDSQKSQH